MFIIKWRNRNTSLKVVTGLSRFETFDEAQNQVDLWIQHFPKNSYWIEEI